MPADPSRSADRLPPGWLDRSETKHRVLTELTGRSARRRRRRRHFLAAGAACVVLLATAGAWWSRSRPESVPVASAVVKTPTRETLPDGSVVEHKIAAAYTVQFTDAVRHVTLTRGTAYFDVVKNPERPFIVMAGGVRVQAVGTAFSVEVNHATVEVLVTEGRVAVAPADEKNVFAPAATTIDAGAGVSVALALGAPGQPPVMQPVPAAAIEEKLAWRMRFVEFSGTPLAEALRILSQHNRVQFSIADPELGRVKLSGVIRADRISGVVQLLEDEGVRIERRGDAEIVLHRAR
jgi:transmembrane sensor